MDQPSFLKYLAKQFISELTPILDIKEVTSNTDLLGSYTEAAVRRLVRRSVEPMRVSRGAVLDFPIPDPLKQVDVIVWAPSPAPAIFDVEGFGLVPRSSVFGVLEVKKSNYAGIENGLEELIDDANAHRNVCDDASGAQDQQRCAGMGVVCVLEKDVSARLAKLLKDDQAVALFERRADRTSPREADVLRLINFLHFVTWRHDSQRGKSNYPQVLTP